MEGFAKSFGITSGVLIAIVIVVAVALFVCVAALCFVCMGPAVLLNAFPTPVP
jgi:hypothetical protein